MTADSDLELAVCSAPGKGRFPARLIRPEDVGVEHRGKGRNQRRVHNILPDSAEADCLLVVEVYTDEGPPARGRRISMIPPSRAKRRSWKKPTITASIRRRALPSSGSTPTTAARRLYGALQPRCGDGAARLPSGGSNCRLRQLLSERDGRAGPEMAVHREDDHARSTRRSIRATTDARCRSG